MTIKELATLTKNLYLEGKGDYLAYFKVGPISHPITTYQENTIVSHNSKMIQFSCSPYTNELIEGKDTTN